MTPLLLGHRGARAFRHIPENTLASFDLCLQHGCDGFEFDVRRSSDGVAVICHDATFGDVEIDKTPSNKLSLPTLENVLEQFAGRAFFDIELKVAGLESQVLTELCRHPPQMGYVVSSFLPDVLSEIHGVDAATPVGLLCDRPHQLRGWRQMPVEWVIPHFELADRELVDQIHEAGKRVMLWTMNREEQMLRFSEWGVDAIISDETELMIRTLR
jgi:glycerophosphoryl diester phosphodiesterase